MGFGKRVCEILAVLGAIILIGALVWYFSGGMRDRGYEKEGTLVWEEQNPPGSESLLMETSWKEAENSRFEASEKEEAAYPAFVTDPASRVYGNELSRSGRGL